MTVFVESPWPAVLLFFVIQVVFGIVFMRTGRAWVLVAMGLVVLALAGMIVLERVIVTEREEVEDTLHGIAEQLTANDIPAVLDAFAPDSPKLAQARSVLGDVTILSARVGSNLEVRVNNLTQPPTATAHFTGRVNARDKRGTVPYENFIRRFKVKLQRHGDRWLIVDYEDADPRNSRF